MAEYHLDVAPDIAEIARLLDWVEECCAKNGVPGKTPFNLALALEEVVANVINYSRAHRIAVELVIEPNRVCAEVIDDGTQFDPLASPEAKTDAPIEDRNIGGLGIHLVRRLMDRVDYQRVDDENRLRMEKSWE